MPQVTLRDLSEWVDIQEIQDTARATFEAQQRRRRNLNAWLVMLLPWFQLVSFVVFYALSAPHTVYLMERITPIWGKLAPIGLELGVVFVAAMRHKNWRGFLTFSILWSLVLVSVIINIGGGFIAVVHSSSDSTMATATMVEIIARFATLPAEYQVLFPLVVIVGTLIPIMGKFSGEAVIKLTSGEIKLEVVTLEDLWEKEQFGYVKSALMRFALKKGAGAKTSGSWAQRIAEQMLDDVDDVVNAVSGQSRDMSHVPSFPKVQAEMGFGGMVQAQKDIQNTEDTGTHGTVMRAALVSQWVKDNPERLQEMLSRPGARRGVSRAISQEIAGNPSGYKTVERVLKSMNIEF